MKLSKHVAKQTHQIRELEQNFFESTTTELAI